MNHAANSSATIIFGEIVLEVLPLSGGCMDIVEKIGNKLVLDGQISNKQF